MEKVELAAFTDDQIVTIETRLEEGKTVQALAREFNFSVPGFELRLKNSGYKVDHVHKRFLVRITKPVRGKPGPKTKPADPTQIVAEFPAA